MYGAIEFNILLTNVSRSHVPMRRAFMRLHFSIVSATIVAEVCNMLPTLLSEMIHRTAAPRGLIQDFVMRIGRNLWRFLQSSSEIFSGRSHDRSRKCLKCGTPIKAWTMTIDGHLPCTDTSFPYETSCHACAHDTKWQHADYVSSRVASAFQHSSSRTPEKPYLAMVGENQKICLHLDRPSKTFER